MLSFQHRWALIFRHKDGTPFTHFLTASTDLLEEPDDVLGDLGQTNDDVVHVDVVEGGMVPALSACLIQDQIPAVDRGEQVLVFPKT